MTKQKGGSGYTKLFKNTLSPCYTNVQKLGWHGGRKKRKMKGGDKIPTCQSLTPNWYNQGQNPASSKSISLASKMSEYQFTRLLPNNSLYTAAQLKMEPPCSPMYPNLVPKTGGSRKKTTRGKKLSKGGKRVKSGLKRTVGKDGKVYFFKNGKRVKNPH
jgi:hypothetical protein